MPRIAILGSGRAARARTRALAAIPGWTEAPPHRAEAIIVATENAYHFELARAGLAAGKHVAVEFPLCELSDQARDLHALAARQDRVLHLEVIGLLASGFAALCSARGDIVSEFEGGAYRWLIDEIAAGRVGQLAVGRLHLLHALAGPLAIEELRATMGRDHYRLEVELRGRGGVAVSLRERRSPTAVRHSTLRVGGLTMARPGRDERLFEADTRAFVAAVRGEQPSYLLAADVIEVVRLAETISAMARGAAP